MDDTPMPPIEAPDPAKVAADGALFLSSKPPSRLQPSQRAHLRSLDAARLTLHHFGRGREPSWVADGDLFAVLMALLEAHTTAPCPPIAPHFGGPVGVQAAAAQRRALKEWQRRAAKVTALPPASRDLAAAAAALLRAYTAATATNARSQLFVLQAMERSFHDGLQGGDEGLEEALRAAGTMLLPCDVWAMFKFGQACLADTIPLPDDHPEGVPRREDGIIATTLQAAADAAGARPWPLVRWGTSMLDRWDLWEEAKSLGQALLAAAFAPPTDPLRIGELAYQVACLHGITDICGVWDATPELAAVMADAATAMAASEALYWADPGMEIEAILADATLFYRSWDAVEGLSASGLVERVLLPPGGATGSDGTAPAALEGAEEVTTGVETAQQGRPDPGEVKSWECAACGVVTSAAQVCSGCKKVGAPAPAFYCGKECQTAHWAQHRLVCEGRKKKEGKKAVAAVEEAPVAAAAEVEGQAALDATVAEMDANNDAMEKEGNGELGLEAAAAAPSAVAAAAVVKEAELKESDVEMEGDAVAAEMNGESQGEEKEGEGETEAEGDAAQELPAAVTDLLNGFVSPELTADVLAAMGRAAETRPELAASLKQRLDADPALAARVNRMWEGKDGGGGVAVGEVVCQVVVMANAAGSSGGGGGGGDGGGEDEGPAQSDPGCCVQ